MNDSLWLRNAWCQFITVLPLVIYWCPSNLFNSFTASLQQSRHFQAFISTSAKRKERLIYFDFICMLNMSVTKQSSLASKSSTTSFQPCAPADGCFSCSILSSTQSQGSITSLSSPTLTPFFVSQNRACASGDSQYDSLAIYLALGLGLISADVKGGSARGCNNCFGAKSSISNSKSPLLSFRGT
jgi:hypothetical protein